MNDSMPLSPAVGAAPPDVVCFDPAIDPLPPVLAAAGGPGALVLLVDTTTDRAWAAETVVALAAAWAGEGRRVVVADLHLDDPVLHERLGEENLDGVVDIFLYGASLARSARPAAGRGFYLIPAGTYTPDAAAVYRHPRWAKLVAGFRDADAMLLLFAPGSAADAAALAQWARDAVVLGAAEGPLVAALREAGVPLRAMLLPPAAPAATPADPDRTLEIGVPVPLPAAVQGTITPSAEPAPPDTAREPYAEVAPPPEADLEPFEPVDVPEEAGTYAPAAPIEEADASVPREVVPEPGEDATLESGGEHAGEPWADAPDDRASEPWVTAADEHAIERDAAGEATATAATSTTARPADVLGIDPLATVPEGVVVRRRRRRRGPLLLLWAGLGVVALAAAVYLVVTSRPEWFRRAGAAEVPPADSLLSGSVAGAAAAAPAAPAPGGTALPYAVQVKAFTTLAAAQRQIEADQRRAEGTRFYVSPEHEHGILYYKVRAGLLADTVEATALRQALVEAGVIDRQDADGAWNLIQYAPLAFDLGAFGDAASAGARADSLAASGVPAYAVEVPYSDGSSRWHLYAGAYRDSTRAEAMRELFTRASLETPPLVERMGKGAGPGE